MASEDPDPRLERLLDAVVSALNPRAVYLFGSRAEGRERPDSDYDLMVVVPDDAPDMGSSLTSSSGTFRSERGRKVAAGLAALDSATLSAWLAQ